MSEADYCYKCDNIITFCGCDESITDISEYVDWAQMVIPRLVDWVLNEYPRRDERWVLSEVTESD